MSVNRKGRARLAEETLAIVRGGHYRVPGRVVAIADDVEECIGKTRLFEPDELTQVLARQTAVTDGKASVIELRNETTLEGASALRAEAPDARIGVLNFASAKNPGGGFLGGSQAQEESLARSSALYPSLTTQDAYYDFHRRQKSPLYSHRIIHSPACPVFRDDSGELLEEPYCVDFLTCPAPNAGAARKKGSQLLPVFQERIELLLGLAKDLQMSQLVLGAWGCGVFRNDPVQVARMFAETLSHAPFRDAFERIRFSVLDNSKKETILKAFATALSGLCSGES